MTARFALGAFLGVCLFIPLDAPAVAQPEQGDPLASLLAADTNGDGVITRDEFNGARIARFARMDRNRDGLVDRDDFRALLRLRPQAGQRVDALIAAGDSNRDGRLSREEQNSAAMPLFDRLDINGDGRIDAAELAAARAHVEEIRSELGGVQE